jgi:hypothetical protein
MLLSANSSEDTYSEGLVNTTESVRCTTTSCERVSNMAQEGDRWRVLYTPVFEGA